MTMDSTKPAIKDSSDEHFLCDDWFDPLEAEVRTRIRGFIEDYWKPSWTPPRDAIAMNGLGLPENLEARGRQAWRAIGTAIASARFLERSERRRFGFLARGSRAMMARRANGRMRPFQLTSAERNGPTR